MNHIIKSKFLPVQSHYSINGQFLPNVKHIFLMAYSCLENKHFFGKVILFTDREAYKYFEWLPYDEIIVTENKIPDEMSHSPLFGKVQAYLQIDKPFFHIDTDAWQWKPFRNEIEDAEVFALSYSNYSNNNICGCKAFAKEVSKGNFKLPDYLQKAFDENPHIHPHHGIIGGSNWKVFNEAGKEVFDIIKDNKDAWKKSSIKWWQFGMILEEMAMNHILKRIHGKTPIPLLLNQGLSQMQELGHTHFCGSSKWEEKNLKWVEHRLKKRYSKYFELCKEKISMYQNDKDFTNYLK